MDPRPSPTPPAKTRPSNSSSSLASVKATSSAQQQPAMPSSSRPARGTTPSAGRGTPKAADQDKPTRHASKDSLTQRMAKKSEEPPKPSKADEVGCNRAPTGLWHRILTGQQQLKALKADFV